MKRLANLLVITFLVLLGPLLLLFPLTLEKQDKQIKHNLCMTIFNFFYYKQSLDQRAEILRHYLQNER